MAFSGAIDTVVKDTTFNDYSTITKNKTEIHHNYAFGPGELFQKFVVPDAAHNRGGSRNRCLEGTRENVIAEIMKWIDAAGDRRICWFSGPAGFGKSAIAQTIADRCAAADTLAASFFFSRGAGDRGRIAGLILTLSYQLTLSVPDTKSKIRDVLQNDPTIPYQSLEDQFQKLIVNPVRTLTEPMRTMVVVIDALDECDDKAGIEQFIEIILRASRDLPLLFFMTGRAENHIVERFAPPEIHSTIYCLALQEFDAHVDIHTFLRSRFSTILSQKPRLMQGVQLPWPSVDDVEGLVEKSSGLFIFASTLVDFVTDGRDAPQEKLKSVLSMHAGLDPLYKQVFSAAPANNRFSHVIGTIMLARDQLSIDAIGVLLQLPTAQILQTLLTIQSILSIPDSNNEPIRILHASLRDFLTDKERSGVYFIDPPIRHTSVTVDCLKLMTEDAKRNKFAINEATLYACQNWCQHLHTTLIEGDKTHFLNSSMGAELTSCLQNFKSSSLDYWVNTLLRVSNGGRVMDSLKEVILCLKRLRNCPRGLHKVFKAIKKNSKKDIMDFAYVHDLVGWVGNRMLTLSRPWSALRMFFDEFFFFFLMYMILLVRWETAS